MNENFNHYRRHYVNITIETYPTSFGSSDCDATSALTVTSMLDTLFANVVGKGGGRGGATGGAMLGSGGGGGGTGTC